jgi:hypothetical protein
VCCFTGALADGAAGPSEPLRRAEKQRKAQQCTGGTGRHTMTIRSDVVSSPFIERQKEADAELGDQHEEMGRDEVI